MLESLKKSKKQFFIRVMCTGLNLNPKHRNIGFTCLAEKILFLLLLNDITQFLFGHFDFLIADLQRDFLECTIFWRHLLAPMLTSQGFRFELVSGLLCFLYVPVSCLTTKSLYFLRRSSVQHFADLEQPTAVFETAKIK